MINLAQTLRFDSEFGFDSKLAFDSKLTLWFDIDSELGFGANSKFELELQTKDWHRSRCDKRVAICRWKWQAPQVCR